MASSESGPYKIVKSITSGDISAYTKYELISGETCYFIIRAYAEVDGKKTVSVYFSPVSVIVE